MGQIPELVSQFYVSNIYTQINYNNEIVRVTPLEYNGLFKYLSNCNDGVKGYIPTKETRERIGEAVRKRYNNPSVRMAQSVRFRGVNNPMYGKSLSEEHRKKLSLSHLGKTRTPHTEETKRKISIANIGIKKPHVGVPRSTECREKISMALNKPVLQFTKGGEFVCEYPSGKAAAFETGTAQQNISRCCLGKSKTANGFIWKFKNL
jgi:hypothetical protein